MRKIFIYTLLFLIHIYILFNFIKLLHKHFEKLVVATLSILSLITLFFIFVAMGRSCTNWDVGLGGVKIDNSVGCQITYPSVCFINIFLGWFDFSAFNNGETCGEIRNDNYNLIRPYLKSDKVKKIGFPRTEGYQFYNESTQEVFTSFVRSNLVDIEKSPNPSAYEVIVNYYDPVPKVTISVKRNDTLVKEREALGAQNGSKRAFKNVLILYIDSLSRPHLMRQLPKTFEWFDERFSNRNAQMESFQFMKYHILGMNTRANMIPGFFGTAEGGPNKGILFIEEFKKSGYITGNSMDYCAREVFESFSGDEKNYLSFSHFDHELVSLYCDPNFGDLSKGGYHINGAYGIRKHCLYSKFTHEYAFEYAKQFWNAYIDQPKVFRYGSMEAHEQTGEVIKYMDSNLVSFLNYFEKNNYLKETLIVFMSDHGLMVPGGFTHLIGAKDFTVEKHLPTLILSLPKNTKGFSEMRDNLKNKEQHMISAYDLYNTLISIPKSSQIGLLFEKGKLGNSCESLRIPSDQCKCIETKK